MLSASSHTRLLVSCVAVFLLNGLALAYPGPRATIPPIARHASPTRLVPTAAVLRETFDRRGNSTTDDDDDDHIDYVDMELLELQARILNALQDQPEEPEEPVDVPGVVITRDCVLCTVTQIFPPEASCESTTIPGCTTTTDEPSPPSPPPVPPPAATPTGVIELSNNSVAIGDANNPNGGADLRNNLLNGLKSLCPEDGHECTTTSPFVIEDIGTVVDGQPKWMKLLFTVQTSEYTSVVERDRMIAMAVAGWEQAAGQSCTEVDYRDWQNPETGSCDDGDGPVKRDGRLSAAPQSVHDRGPLEKRILGGPGGIGGCLPGECTAPPHECDYKATVCAAPNLISVTVGDGANDPYANHLDVTIEAELEGETWAEWFCEHVAPALPELAMALFPELAPADVALGEMVLQVACGAVDQDVGVDQD